MSNVVELRTRKSILLSDMEGQAKAIQKTYESLDEMYTTLKNVEEQCTVLEEMFNDTFEQYELDGHEVPEHLAQYYSRGLPDIGAFTETLKEALGDFENITVTKVKVEDFDKLSEHPEFPAALSDPERLAEIMDEMGIENHGDKEE